MSRSPEVSAFIEKMTWQEAPAIVKRRIAYLCADGAAAALAGRRVPASKIVADYAHSTMSGTESTCLLDGRKASAAGAALANGTLMNALDYDDGHSIAKGHPGAVVIPAALAVAEAVDASHEEFLTACLIGYEIALRAAIAQHARWPQFHSSGAWGALGAAAAAARLLQLSTPQIDAALGFAEYHAPIDLVMNAVAEPTMAKDAMGWGAHVGVTGAQLSAAGFTTHRPEFLSDVPLAEIGDQWEVLNTYVKPYPCCRWAHPALAAARRIRETGLLDAEVAAIREVRIRTFEAAAQLSRRIPKTSEQAQFNLIWPVAWHLRHGDFGIDAVVGGFEDDGVAAIASKVRIVVDADLTAVFPRRRASEIIIAFHDGHEVASGECVAAGDPDDPEWETVVRQKLPQIASDQWQQLDGAAAHNSMIAMTRHDPFNALLHPLSIKPRSRS